MHFVVSSKLIASYIGCYVEKHVLLHYQGTMPGLKKHVDLCLALDKVEEEKLAATKIQEKK